MDGAHDNIGCNLKNHLRASTLVRAIGTVQAYFQVELYLEITVLLILLLTRYIYTHVYIYIYRVLKKVPI